MHDYDIIKLIRSVAYQGYDTHIDTPFRTKNTVLARIERHWNNLRGSSWGDEIEEEIRIVMDEILNKENSA